MASQSKVLLWGTAISAGILFLLFTFSVRVLAENSNAALVSPLSPVSFEKTYFGLHVYDPLGTAHWPSTGFGAVRLWDNKVIWANLEPSKGIWFFDDLDRLVKKAEQSKAEVLLVLGQTPTWASNRPQEASPYYPGNAAEPANIEDWKVYVRTVATRYRGRIRAYEIWNEPNLKMFWSGSFTKLAELEREAYQIIKSIDPSATVVSASLTVASKDTLESFFSSGNGKYADVIGYHFYTPKSPPEKILDFVSILQNVLEKNGLRNKPVWNTEAGWLIPEDSGVYTDKRVDTYWRDWKRLSPEQGAAYAIRALLIQRVAGIERFYWYGWDHNGMGLTSGYGLPVRKAGLGYMAASKWLVGSRVVKCDIENDVWSCPLIKGKGKAWVVWSTAGKSTIPKELLGKVVASEDYMGRYRKSIDGIEIDEVPIILFGQFGLW